MSSAQRVFITSMSLTSPLGCRISEFSERMFRGDSGIVDIRGKIVPENFPIPYAGLIPAFDWPSVHENNLPLEIRRQLEHFIQEISKDLQGLEEIDAVYFGSNSHMAEWGHVISFFKEGHQNEEKWMGSDSPLQMLQKLLKALQVNVANPHLIGIQSTCVTGNSAIGRGFNRIRAGKANAVLVGAYEQRMRPAIFAPLHLLGALCEKEFPKASASRPFDRQRSGFVRGEGGGVLLLESEKSIEKRNANPIAEVLGFSHTSDAYRMTDEREDLKGAEKALRSVLADAKLSINEVNYINAHGTSTPLNDKIETAVIKKVFGARAYDIPISSLKSQIGHLNMACGIVEVLATALMLKHQKVAPTLNYTEPDPDCDLDYVPNESRDLKMKYAISNSFGFGGLNSCMVLGAV